MRLVIRLLALSFAVSAQAGTLYSYKDNQGTVHAVDSLEAVPTEYRALAKTTEHSEAERQPAAVAASNTSCKSKRYCATIYISPWCPFCKAREKEFLRYINGKASADKGVRVVVGAGRKPGDNAATAAKFGAHGEADDSMAVAEALGVDSFPTVFVQENGRTILQGSSAESWLRTNF